MSGEARDYRGRVVGTMSEPVTLTSGPLNV